jgi:hypothetical protein
MERIRFSQTFFLKSILDIYLCPISKIKKKFAKMKTAFFSNFIERIVLEISNDKWFSNFCQKKC